jgi:hypothetical protein
MKPQTDPMSAPSWPPTKFSIPELWTRARALFGVLMREVQSVATLRAQPNMRRKQRTDILCRLVPVEKLVRSLLVTEAIIYLLMTPQGRKLLATTPKIALPEPPPPVGQKKAAPHKTTIPMPGWHTIAALLPRVDPRVTAPEPPPPLDLNDAENWSCRFRVLGWRHPAPEDDPPPKEAPRKRWISALDDSSFPAINDPRGVPAAAAASDAASKPSSHHLARRVEALTRVLANPEPTIRRLAKFIASLPRGALAEPFARNTDSLWWWHGRPEFFNACALCAPAVRALSKREEPD